MIGVGFIKLARTPVFKLPSNYPLPREGGTSFVDHLFYLGPVFVMLSRLFIAALWSPAGKELTSWLLLVMFKCV